MALEDLTGPNKFIANLVPANPPATDPASQGSDHIQGIKNVLQNSFPGMAGANAFNGVISAPGVKLPAIQVASSDPNTLDDYEEGTCTLGLIGESSNPTVPPTTTGRYTKIGNMVTLFGYFANVDTTGGSGYMRITGLPFPAGGGNTLGSVAMAGFGNVAAVIYAQAGQSVAMPIEITTTNRLSMVAGPGKYFQFTLTYFTA